MWRIFRSRLNTIFSPRFTSIPPRFHHQNTTQKHCVLPKNPCKSAHFASTKYFAYNDHARQLKFKRRKGGPRFEVRLFFHFNFSLWGENYADVISQGSGLLIGVAQGDLQVDRNGGWLIIQRAGREAILAYRRQNVVIHDWTKRSNDL